MRIYYSKVGQVSLVGAGPGDPDLLTLRAARLLEQAEVVVYDRLVDVRILALAPDGCELICVGKKGGHYNFPQPKINELLVAKAREGKRVVRLKGGDPFLFGRGGEEVLHLIREKIPCQVVPGVSSALAVPAAAGIPVTHRNLASSVTIVTGHQAEDSDRPVRWDRLARATDTLVVLMPLHNLKHIVSQLVLHGRPLDTPACLIQAGTLEGQKRLVSTLKEIVAEAARAGVESPALLVVGEVVDLAEILAPGKVKRRQEATDQPAAECGLALP